MPPLLLSPMRNVKLEKSQKNPQTFLGFFVSISRNCGVDAHIVPLSNVDFSPLDNPYSSHGVVVAYSKASPEHI